MNIRQIKNEEGYKLNMSKAFGVIVIGSSKLIAEGNCIDEVISIADKTIDIKNCEVVSW